MLKKIVLIICVIILQACASTKGYMGEERPVSELAVIYAAESQRNKGNVLIEQVNGFEVGNATKGWPHKVETLPGEVKLKVKFVTLGESLTMGLGGAVGGIAGGAVGGAVVGSFQDEIGAKDVLVATVEKGKSYRIHYSTETNSQADLKIWLEPYIPKK